MLRACLALLILSAPLLADPVPAAGRIEKEGSDGTCSAVLIAPDLVLTAAHCAGGSASARSFRAGAGSEAPSYALSEVARHPFYDADERRPGWKVRFDIGMARLDAAVPDWVAHPIPIGRPAEIGERLFILSWRRADGELPRQRACPVIKGIAGVVTLGCPVVGGESGAPVMRKTNEGLELVAIVSSRPRLGAQPVALATDAKLRIQPLLDLLD